jgi:hypothetical protein
MNKTAMATARHLCCLCPQGQLCVVEGTERSTVRVVTVANRDDLLQLPGAESRRVALGAHYCDVHLVPDTPRRIRQWRPTLLRQIPLAPRRAVVPPPPPVFAQPPAPPARPPPVAPRRAKRHRDDAGPLPVALPRAADARAAAEAVFVATKRRRVGTWTSFLDECALPPLAPPRVSVLPSLVLTCPPQQSNFCAQASRCQSTLRWPSLRA